MADEDLNQFSRDPKEKNTADVVEENSDIEAYEELQDAAPVQKIKLSLTGKIASGVVIFWIFIALFGSYLAPFHEADLIADDSYLPSDSQFLLGSDYLGRDTLSRIMWGARRTIGCAVAATLFAYGVGISLGILAAFKGGWVDIGLSRIVDVNLSFPAIMLALIVIAALGTSLAVLIITTGLVYTSGVFRLARALGQDTMVQDFVEVAKGRGEGARWIIFSEILPNAAMPLATDFGLRLVYVILFISGLSFLGLGIQPPMADWGSMVRENLQGLSYGSFSAIWPALAIASLTIPVNLIVDDVSAESGGSLAKKMV
jgi:peptide/nickel transport system permease protein